VAPEEATESGLATDVLERRLLLAHEASTREWIDGLVMPFPPQLAQRWRSLLVRDPLLSGEQAVALAGLFLRAHGDFTIEIAARGTNIHASHDQMYRIGAAALLPGISRWLVAATEEWRSSGDPAMDGLADAVMVRFGRALKARDYLQVRLRAPDHDAAWSDVLFFFESVLVSLQGSLDAAARFLHLKYKLPGSRRRANWGNEKWGSHLEASAAPASTFDGRLRWDLDALIGELRNSIHGEVLSDQLRRMVGTGENPLRMGYMRAGIALEPEVAERIGEAAERQGGTNRRLRQTFPEGVALIDPWDYTESAMDAVAKALGSVIEAVNIESLTDVEVSPQFEELWTGSRVRRTNGAMLFGVGVLSPTGS
jgi:hypothetical protein